MEWVPAEVDVLVAGGPDRGQGRALDLAAVAAEGGNGQAAVLGDVTTLMTTTHTLETAQAGIA